MKAHVYMCFLIYALCKVVVIIIWSKLELKWIESSSQNCTNVTIKKKQLNNSGVVS
jgi:hypothetical protein